MNTPPLTDNTQSWRYPYGTTARYHMHHPHVFASENDKTIAFYSKWFDAKVAHDGPYADSRNVFLKIGIGALHLYDQPPRDLGRNAVHHLGIQVVGLADLYARMKAADIHLPGPTRPPEVLEYYGYS